jgi:hypothetical protein
VDVLARVRAQDRALIAQDAAAAAGEVPAVVPVEQDGGGAVAGGCVGVVPVGPAVVLLGVPPPW